MDYQAMYQQKLTTAQEAVKVVKSGDWVDYTWCTNHPVALDKALAERKDELTDVKIRGGVTMWMPEIAKAEDAGDHFTWHSWHCSGIDRKIITKGMGYFSPMRYSELQTQAKIISERYEEISTAIQEKMDRGTTLLYMEGGHSGKQSRAILVVVSGRELQKLNRIVMDIDDQAFMIVSQVGEVRGRGFTLTKKYE